MKESAWVRRHSESFGLKRLGAVGFSQAGARVYLVDVCWLGQNRWPGSSHSPVLCLSPMARLPLLPRHWSRDSLLPPSPRPQELSREVDMG